MIADKTIKSKNQPKQTNVTWIDLSGKTPVEKHFINGRWQAIGGSSGSGSGCDCGGFKYNELPEPIQFRNPIGEEGNTSEIFGSVGRVIAVLDLKDGIVPKEIILQEYEDGPCEIYQLTAYSKYLVGDGTLVSYCRSSSNDGIHDIEESFGGTSARISKDGTLLGIIGSGIS